MTADARREAETTARYLLGVADETRLGEFEEELVECIRALLAAEPAKGACADCGGCGGLGWIPAGDEQLGCIDCNGKGTIEPAPPAGAENERLRAAATEALDVLTRLADSAAYWSDYDVPVGIVAEIDAAKARLAGVLRG